LTLLIEKTLLNVFIILLPICFYQILWRERNGPKETKYNPIIFGIVCSIALVMCMAFPVKPVTNLYFDMRMIPIYISILYGGTSSGGIVVEHITIEIIDFGEGMTDEQINQLGTPFYSTKEKGTGLGMMLCYRIVEHLRGKLEIQSKKGSGTKISIKLPKAS
jgi:hypothetical protein